MRRPVGAASYGGDVVATRSSVKEIQKLLAQLDAAHTRALGRLEATVAKRSEILVEQDQLVASAETGVHGAVAAMAAGVGQELAATLLGLDVVEVRRRAKLAPEHHADRQSDQAPNRDSRRKEVLD
jgi:hypothetical protein